MRHSKSMLLVDDEGSRLLADINPGMALMGERPRLVDEWQEAPKLWDAARREIDFSARSGNFIFTGSVTPPTEAVKHSGVGRFARLNMRTLSLFESEDSDGSVPLSRLFDGGFEQVRSAMSYQKAVELICRGGWPSMFRSGGRADAPRMYVEMLLDSDLKRLTGRRMSRSTMSSLMRSLARNSAGSATLQSIGLDISQDRPPAPTTVRAYLNAMRAAFIIEEQEAWSPSLRSKVRVRAAPKRHFTDPSLAAAALDAKQDVLARDVRTAGRLFESMCYRDLCVYASAMDGRVAHYRDNSGLEVDEIVQLGDGRWGAFEVKLGISEIDKAAKNLLRLKSKVGADAGEPSFLGVLCATSGISYTREDGVHVVALDNLGP